MGKSINIAKTSALALLASNGMQLSHCRDDDGIIYFTIRRIARRVQLRYGYCPYDLHLTTCHPSAATSA